MTFEKSEFEKALRAKVHDAAKPRINIPKPRAPFDAFMDGVEPLIVEIARLSEQVQMLQQHVAKG